MEVKESVTQRPITIEERSTAIRLYRYYSRKARQYADSRMGDVCQHEANRLKGEWNL
jgi:hypothetical protein